MAVQQHTYFFLSFNDLFSSQLLFIFGVVIIDTSMYVDVMAYDGICDVLDVPATFTNVFSVQSQKIIENSCSLYFLSQ